MNGAEAERMKEEEENRRLPGVFNMRRKRGTGADAVAGAAAEKMTRTTRTTFLCPRP